MKLNSVLIKQLTKGDVAVFVLHFPGLAFIST